MLDLETFTTAANTLYHQGWRSNLTILGIVLGITAIIALISLGEGLNASVTQQFNSLGTNTLTVLPGKSFADTAFSKLQSDDLDTIQSVRGVDFGAEVFIRPEQLEFKGEKKTAIVLGVDPEKMVRLGAAGFFELDKGRNLSSQDLSGVVVGPKLAEKQFKRPVKVNMRIGIEGSVFKVVGINKVANNALLGSFFDNSLILNSKALEQVAGKKLAPNRITVNLLPGSDPLDVKARIVAALKKKHGKEDFQVQTAQQTAQTAGDVLGIIQLVLVGIAGISLLVGAVGIMNTMFMSVTERTREIGILKAIGATNQKVLSIFLAEALLIGLAGGIIGTILGSALAILVSIIATAVGFELQAVISLSTILFAVSFSVAIGIFSGLWPAKTAADLDPVDAIRHSE